MNVRGLTRRGLLTAGAAALGLGLSGCGEPFRPPLRIAANPWPGYEPLYTARDLGLLDERQVRLVEFTSTSEAMRVFRSQDCELIAVTLDEALLLAAQGHPLQVILVADQSHGSDVLLARPGIESLGDLRGRTVGVEDTALGAYMLSRALETAGLSAGDLTVVRLPLDEHEGAWRAGGIEAVVTFEPVASRLRQNGAKTLFSSADIPGEVIDILVAHDSLLPERLGSIAHLVQAWFTARDELESDSIALHDRVRHRLRLPLVDSMNALAGIRFPDLAENRKLLQGPSPPLHEVMERHALHMRAGGLLAAEVAVDPMFRWSAEILG